MKIQNEREKRDVEKLCAEDDELKALQGKIKAAYSVLWLWLHCKHRQLCDNEDVQKTILSL